MKYWQGFLNSLATDGGHVFVLIALLVYGTRISSMELTVGATAALFAMLRPTGQKPPKDPQLPRGEIMNPFTAIARAFAGLGRLITRALQSGFAPGLSDAVIDAALGYIRTAGAQFTDNTERREWVVQQLMAKMHLPESIARLAVELAIQLYKREVWDAKAA